MHNERRDGLSGGVAITARVARRRYPQGHSKGGGDPVFLVGRLSDARRGTQ